MIYKIMKEVDPKFICIDVANGYMSRFVETCALIRYKYPKKIDLDFQSQGL